MRFDPFQHLLVCATCFWLSASPFASTACADYELASGQTRVVVVADANRLTCQWGVVDGALLPPGEPITGEANGVSIGSAALEIVDVSKSGEGTLTPTLSVLARLKQLPVEFRLVFRAQGDTGVIETDLECINKGDSPVDLAGLSSLACRAGSGELGTLELMQRMEWNLNRQKLANKPVRFGNKNDGRSSGRISPWWSLSMPNNVMTMVVALGYSGNWQAEFAPRGRIVDCRFGMVFDDEKPLRLAHGASFKLPTAAVAIVPGEDLDAAANAHHRYQRQFVFRRRPEGVPLLVQFNTWYAYGQDVDQEKLLKMIPLAAQIGCEVFVIDAGWYGDQETSGPVWKMRSGDWRIDTAKFPEGLTPIIRAANDHGMKFGLWLEPELLSTTAPVFRSHPEWCLAKDGKPIVVSGRAHLDFSIPEVREYMTQVLEKLTEEGTIDWVKLDYNMIIGANFDSTRDDVFQTRLHDHLAGYNLWLASLGEKYPNMIIENCSSGAKRWDSAILSHAHSSWISDVVNPRMGPQLMWGSLLHSAPEMCNHWMTGDVPEEERASIGGGKITSESSEWWEFMHVAAMGGQYGISARLDQWPEAALNNAKDCIDRYKQFRHLIDNADVYHLTPQPAPGPTPAGWMAIEFLQPSADRGFVLAFRLERGPASKLLKLKGLDADRRYRVTPYGESPYESTGQDLMEKGMQLEASDPWRARTIELETVE